ncbi:MAG: ATP-binding cassette domain-containing protein [Salinivirgaceae bacterium]|jgi:ABC-2 type transport system ATP-binding protein|nr:ATP-binding cassette domain-containing protein [Salinivirgaceae bacterium]
MTPILTIDNINKSFINHRALTDVSLEIPEGSVFGLLGPNGAGKTTLIRIINQISYPDSGTIFFNNKPLRRKDVENIGYLPEERGLYKKMKVGEQALYLARLKGLSKQDALKKLKYWFEKFEIEQWWDKKVEELSKGMAQKVQFIVTIIHEPQLLIFDEPFSGFDPINANLLRKEILELRQKGATVIFSTHNMGSVEEICDNIALINNSKKILEGKVNEVKKGFRTFEYEFKYEGTTSIAEKLEDRYKLISEKQLEEEQYCRIKINDASSPNELLKNVMQHATVHSFNEIIPSMNDIFIEVVNQHKTQN